MKALIVICLAGLAWFSACSSSSDDDGTESHFLDACDSSATCGSLSCLEGRCTRACGNDADCADLGDAECRSDGALSRCAAPGDTASGGGSGGDSSASGGTGSESGAAGGGGSSATGGAASGGSTGTGGVGGTNATGGTATDGGVATGGTATDGGVTTDGGAGGSDIGGGDPGDAGAFSAGASGADVIACAEPTLRTVDGEDTGFVQCGPASAAIGASGPRFELVVLHRERAVECPNLLPRVDDGACSSNGLSEVDVPCLADSDCTAGPYGFCSEVPTVHYPQCGCSYGCVSDADCGPDEICECADPVGLCRPATCTVDSDCGNNALCASAPLAVSSCTFFPAERGYRCQSEADICLSDAECTAPEAAACTFSAEAGARSCERAPVPCP